MDGLHAEGVLKLYRSPPPQTQPQKNPDVLYNYMDMDMDMDTAHRTWTWTWTWTWTCDYGHTIYIVTIRLCEAVNWQGILGEWRWIRMLVGNLSPLSVKVISESLSI